MSLCVRPFEPCAVLVQVRGENPTSHTCSRGGGCRGPFQMPVDVFSRCISTGKESVLKDEL